MNIKKQVWFLVSLVLWGISNICYSEGDTANTLNKSGFNAEVGILTRFESWKWFESAVSEGKYDYGFQRTRARVSYENEVFSVFAEPQYVVMSGLPDDAVAPLPLGPSGMGGALLFS